VGLLDRLRQPRKHVVAQLYGLDDELIGDPISVPINGEADFGGVDIGETTIAGVLVIDPETGYHRLPLDPPEPGPNQSWVEWD